jgi:glycosyltransferase involved in cell wall biosynthesis
MKNLLFISVYPFPLDMGSKQHAYFFIKALCEHFNVYCLFFIPPGFPIPMQDELDAIDLDIKGLRLCFFNTPNKNKNYLEYLRNIVNFPNSFTKLATHSNGYHAIKSCIEKYSIDTVHFEHFWFTNYIFKLNKNLKKVIVYHDLHHTIFKQQIKYERRLSIKIQLFFEMIKCYIFERLLDRHVSLKVFLNPTEMELLPKKAVYIPHIVNSDIQYQDARDTDFFNILFLGAYNHAPNRFSVAFIIDQILPNLLKTINNFKIHIIGPGTENFLDMASKSLYKEFVWLHGFKKDINDAFKNMDLALFPIIYGGGVKTKIIDAMAAGVPVVTTPEGLTGMTNLPANCIGVGNTPEEIVRAMLALMSSCTLRKERSRSGRQYITEEHSFEAFSRKVTETYMNIN